MDHAADRAEIVEVLRRYARGIDTKDYDTVRASFTADATLDYTCVGGPRASRDEVVDWLQQMLEVATCTQHLLSNHDIVVDGDAATSRVELFNPFLVAAPDRGPEGAGLLLLGGSYEDRWRRTASGWRITERRHLIAWRAGPMEGSVTPLPADADTGT